MVWRRVPNIKRRVDLRSTLVTYERILCQNKCKSHISNFSRFAPNRLWQYHSVPRTFENGKTERIDGTNVKVVGKLYIWSRAKYLNYLLGAFFEFRLWNIGRISLKKALKNYFLFSTNLHVYSFRITFTLVPPIRFVLPFSNERGTGCKSIFLLLLFIWNWRECRMLASLALKSFEKHRVIHARPVSAS